MSFKKRLFKFGYIYIHQRKNNVVYETIIFREAQQESHENVEVFATRLRKLAVNCDFADPEKKIQMQIVAKCCSSQLKKRALEKDRSLSNLLELARTLELSDVRGRDVAALHSKQLNKIHARVRRENIPTNYVYIHHLTTLLFTQHLGFSEMDSISE